MTSHPGAERRASARDEPREQTPEAAPGRGGDESARRKSAQDGDPGGDLGEEHATALQVELHGRSIKLYRASGTALASTIGCLTIAASLPSGARSGFLTSLPGIGLGAWTALTWLLVGLRVGARREARHRRRGAHAKSPAAHPETDLVICCSGGGIKSAAFCLGALRALDDAGIFRTATKVFAVSGGGYVASSLALLNFRRAERHRCAGTPTDPPPPLVTDAWVTSTRQMTDYLTSSARARFDLGASLLLGIGVNLVLGCSIITVLSWFATQLALATGLASWSPGGGSQFDVFGFGALHYAWPPVLLTAASVVVFSLPRLTRSTDLLGSTSARRWRPGDSTRRHAELKDWLTNLPNGLLVAALGYTVLVLLLPLTAAWVIAHPQLAELLRVPNVEPEAATATGSATPSPGDTATWWNDLRVALGALVAALAGYGLTIRSALQGLLDAPPTTLVGQVVKLLRRQVAPALAAVLWISGVVLVSIVVSAHVLTLDPESPRAELAWPLVPLALLALLRLLGPAETTSMFPFYRDRLQAAYLSVAADGGPDRHPMPTLAEIAACEVRPRLVLCATANVRDGQLLPAGRRGTPFVLGDEVGLVDATLPGGGRVLPASATGNSPNRPGGLDHRAMTLADAMAISGAAFAPLAGRDSVTIGRYRLILALANLRIGAWVRNPYWEPPPAHAHPLIALDDWVDATSVYYVLREAIGTPSIYMPYLYLTDGGHYDNLGLDVALRARPRRVILLDGSGDDEDRFPAMGEAIATARMDLGVQIDFDPTALTRGSAAYPASAHVRANATYPAAPDGSGVIEHCVIDYLKCVLPADQGWDLQSYRLAHPDFPATSQSYERFDELEFEAFRQLGARVAAGYLSDTTGPQSPEEGADADAP